MTAAIIVTRAVMRSAFTADATGIDIQEAARALILAYEDGDHGALRKGLRELRDARARLDAVIGEIEREGR